MATLAFVELAEGKVKKTSLEAVAYAAALGSEVVAVVAGSAEASELEGLGKYGAAKVLHADDARLDKGIIRALSAVLAAAVGTQNADTVVLANSSIGTPVAARTAAKIGAAIVTNVVEVPDTSSGYIVKKSIYTGKAFTYVSVKAAKRVLAIRKNAIALRVGEGKAKVELFKPELKDQDFTTTVVSTEKASGQVLLPEAEIVVSGGRGMKGPEHWGMLEELAKVLGAASGCSKPVSDMGWRPHHEHVGQTGIKVSPQLYIAVGISGAIQHLAGVNSSKYILVINKDPEAPFFKAADYGVVGDAFEIVPKLTEAIKATR